ncbi:unnamed protein product [Amoebophrya sp. A25]|nr:unnamed protein product [Amoebophrya sp. A25]|eukprot:GSA25T00009917001.1
MGARWSSTMRTVLFQPPQCSYETSESKSFVLLRTRLGDRIAGYYFDIGARDTLLFSHANAEDLGLCLGFGKELGVQLRVNVFVYDYCGYGVSTGEPSEDGLYACIEAAYDYLRFTCNIPWEHIILFGRSIGTGPTVYMASRKPCRGVVLQAAMSSIFRIMFKLRFTLWGDQFANIDRVANIEAPTLIIHGLRDEIVPISHGVDLFSRLKRPVEPLWVDDADHNSLSVDLVVARMRRFLLELEQMPFTEGQRRQHLDDVAQRCNKDTNDHDSEGGGDGGGTATSSGSGRLENTGAGAAQSSLDSVFGELKSTPSSSSSSRGNKAGPSDRDERAPGSGSTNYNGTGFRDNPNYTKEHEHHLGSAAGKAVWPRCEFRESASSEDEGVSNTSDEADDSDEGHDVELQPSASVSCRTSSPNAREVDRHQSHDSFLAEKVTPDISGNVNNGAKIVDDRRYFVQHDRRRISEVMASRADIEHRTKNRKLPETGSKSTGGSSRGLKRIFPALCSIFAKEQTPREDSVTLCSTVDKSIPLVTK